MFHSRLTLRLLPDFYREMTFLSYRATEHRDERGHTSTYVTITGTHLDYSLTTIVQTHCRADAISEELIDFTVGEWWNEDGEWVKYDPEVDEPTTTVEDRAALKLLGAAAFEVALEKATEAGVIRPMIRSATSPAKHVSDSLDGELEASVR